MQKVHLTDPRVRRKNIELKYSYSLIKRQKLTIRRSIKIYKLRKLTIFCPKSI